MIQYHVLAARRDNTPLQSHQPVVLYAAQVNLTLMLGEVFAFRVFLGSIRMWKVKFSANCVKVDYQTLASQTGVMNVLQARNRPQKVRHTVRTALLDYSVLNRVVLNARNADRPDASSKCTNELLKMFLRKFV